MRASWCECDKVRMRRIKKEGKRASGVLCDASRDFGWRQQHAGTHRERQRATQTTNKPTAPCTTSLLIPNMCCEREKSNVHNPPSNYKYNSCDAACEVRVRKNAKLKVLRLNKKAEEKRTRTTVMFVSRKTREELANL